MPLVTISILLGVVAARRFPPRVDARLGRRALWLCPPIVAAWLVQALVIRIVPDGWRSGLVIATTVVAIAWTAAAVLALPRSPVRLGIVLFVLGACMNLVPIIERGHMPVSRDALRDAGMPIDDDVGRGHPAKHAIVDHDDTPILGDRIPIRPLWMVASIGDLVQAVGVVLVVRAVWPRGHRRVRRRSGEATVDATFYAVT
jgi:hypothetical protein